MATPKYTVLSVPDGDTLRVVSENGTKTIRLACIDAPEKTQVPYGANSRSALIGMVPVGTPVGIRAITLDNYGREVAEVFTGSKNINLKMVESGNAFAYRAYMKGCDKSSYFNAEGTAKNKRLGVWLRAEGITRPWLWRHAPSPKPQPTCQSLTSEEAKELYSQGHIYLDKNNDGVPCNGTHGQ